MGQQNYASPMGHNRISRRPKLTIPVKGQYTLELSGSSTDDLRLRFVLLFRVLLKFSCSGDIDRAINLNKQKGTTLIVLVVEIWEMWILSHLSALKLAF